MRVRFLENKVYSPNGWDNKESLKGDCEDISQELADSFIEKKICTAIDAPKVLAGKEKEAPKVKQPEAKKEDKPVKKTRKKKGGK